MLRILNQQFPTNIRHTTRRSQNPRPIQLHQRLPLRLPIIHRPYPENKTLQTHQTSRIRQSRPPLTRPSLSGHPNMPLLSRIIRLSQRRIHLVTTSRRQILTLCNTIAPEYSETSPTSAPDTMASAYQPACT